MPCKLPHLNAFLDSNLIALEKAGGRGVQLIAAERLGCEECDMAACALSGVQPVAEHAATNVATLRNVMIHQ
jgi:hypothetical protein